MSTPSNAPPVKRPTVNAGGRLNGGAELFRLASPCVSDTRELGLSVAAKLGEICAARHVPGSSPDLLS
jgi:hypothetical protein